MFWSECLACGCNTISHRMPQYALCRPCRWVYVLLGKIAVEKTFEEAEREFENLPELTAEERAAMDATPPDFIDRLLRGERPLTDPKTFAN